MSTRKLKGTAMSKQAFQYKQKHPIKWWIKTKVKRFALKWFGIRITINYDE